MFIGYEFLRKNLNLEVFPIERPACVGPVQRIVSEPGKDLLVPKHVAPSSSHPLEHLLFALKHEGTNLQILSEALPKIGAHDLMEKLRETPSSLFIRKACYLWEQFTGQSLNDLPPVGGNYGDLFDAEKYLTGSVTKNAKWRINFNGLGSLHYCPTVQKTPLIQAGIDDNIIEQTQAFIREMDPAYVDRAMAWAYLSETEHSFAIERELPSSTRAQTFVALLQESHQNRDLTEQYLCDLQSSTITNPYDQASSFRQSQNWLRTGGLRGAASISFVPPDPELCHELMPLFMRLANTLPQSNIDPIIAAAISSFGFVFLHPFMDGNGRLSRFLFHHALCRSGKLDQGLLLPVSIAMKKNETAYLTTLKNFSAPARTLWDVRWIDEDKFDLKFKGSHNIYRYWDATPCVEFGFEMARQALDVHLTNETQHLMLFDRVYAGVNNNYDVQNNVLHILITSAMQNSGKVSTRRRKQFVNYVSPDVFDFIEDSIVHASQTDLEPNDSPRPQSSRPKG